MNTTSTNRPAKGAYDAAFYAAQLGGSLRSAEVYLEHLFKYHPPASVADLGCGRGAWLKACADLGAQRLVGYDGPWNSQAQMVDSRITFVPTDLSGDLGVEDKFDLAMSLEVAEHLDVSVAERFVRSLTQLSDVVLLGAAMPGQVGTHHVNERYPSFWGRLMTERGYAVFDLFRPKFWTDDRVDPWYRQNTFLYVRRAHALATRLSNAGLAEMGSVDFMDCVHPWMYERYLSGEIGIKHHLKHLGPAVVRSVRRRLRWRSR